tara:strand:+ start:93 stop:647 length:555 start_codon:yes stop_codon:yes gene_type:complete
MIENWWPTQIGYYDNPNHVDISSHCLDIKNRVEHPNITTISKDTYITYKNYNIIGKPEFYSINNFVFKCVFDYMMQTQMQFKYKVAEGWFCVYERGDYHEFHDHCPSIISCVYFMNESESKLFFGSNFRDQQAIDYKEFFNNTNTPIGYETIPGRCIVFRSYQLHCVEKHKSDTPRVTLSYNFR